MTGGINDPKRYMHVKRVFYVDETTGETDTDVWADLLRIDSMRCRFSSYITGGQGVLTRFAFKWQDDKNKGGGEGPQGNPQRKYQKKFIRNPEDPTDQDTWIRLYTIKKLQMRSNGFDTGAANQRIGWAFKNANRTQDPDLTEGPSDAREFKVLRVYNNDLTGVELSDGNFTNPMNWDEYRKHFEDPNAKVDLDQYVDVEITERFYENFQTADGTLGDNLGPAGQGVQGQKLTYSLKKGNADFEGDFKRGPDGPLVFRTDPIQTIINIDFGGLAVIFGPRNEDCPDPSDPENPANSKKIRKTGAPRDPQRKVPAFA